jgi:transcriptional regulator of acetoin/glycerol metabolism
VQFQLVSASHHDLARAVAEGRFREDLYYRLAGFEVALPPLRERSDKRALIERLLAHETAGSGESACLGDAARALLEQHAWPGNVRQLRHVLRSAVALADGAATIGVEHLPSLTEAAQRSVPAPAMPATSAGPQSADNGGPALPRLGPLQAKEREVLLQLLEQHRWNVSNVAKALDVSRNTLYRKLHKLHIALTHASGRDADAGPGAG